MSRSIHEKNKELLKAIKNNAEESELRRISKRIVLKRAVKKNVKQIRKAKT